MTRTIELSICISSYNRSEEVCQLLDSISIALNRDLVEKNSIEVVVCLDGSTDDSIEKIELLVPKFPCHLRFSWQENMGLAAARNTLIDSANGRRIWLLDDDMLLGDESFLTHYRNEDLQDSLLVGSCRVIGNELVSGFYEDRWRKIVSQGGGVNKPEFMSFANTSGLTSTFLKYKFNPEFKGYGFEDYELAIRMLQDGIEIRFDEKASVIHKFERSSKKILQNAFEEGVNRVKLQKLHPDCGGFSLIFKPSLVRRVIVKLAKLRLHRTLRFLSLLLIVASNVLSGNIKTRIFVVAKFMSLQSGIAKANGSVTWSVDRN